jgi:hypothetical protein
MASSTTLINNDFPLAQFLKKTSQTSTATSPRNIMQIAKRLR